MLETTHNGSPMVWNGHLCEGDQMVPFDRGTFLLWTCCGRHDVPANAAQAGPNALSHVTCPECLTVYTGYPGKPE